MHQIKKSTYVQENRRVQELERIEANVWVKRFINNTVSRRIRSKTEACDAQTEHASLRCER